MVSEAGTLLKPFSLFLITALVITGAFIVLSESEDTDAALDDPVTVLFKDGYNSKLYDVREGHQIQLPTQLFSKDGSYLSGWNDGSESFLPGEWYTVKGHAELTAEWTTPTYDRIRHLEDIVLQPNEEMEETSLFATSEDLSGNIDDIEVPEWFELVPGANPSLPAYTGSTAQPGIYLVSYTKAAFLGINATLCWYTITVPSEMDEEYEIKIDANGGLGSTATLYVTKGTGLVLPGVDDYTWTGTGTMTLVGWNIRDSEGNTPLSPPDSMYVPDTDTTMVANWVSNPNVLVYSLDGGSLENTYATVTWSDEPVSLRTDAQKAGHTFLGWKITQNRDAVYAPGLNVFMDNTTYLEAYFVPNGTSLCTVTFDAGGGSTLVTTQKVESGKYVYLPQSDTVLDGYSFLGWSTEPPTGDGVDDRSTISQEFVEITTNTTFYAVYHDDDIIDPDPEDPDDPNPDPKPQTYTITFNSNGGDTTYPQQKIVEGNRISEPADPMKDGCIFLGWAVVGQTTVYDFSTPVDSNLTLYAMWDDLFTIEYGVSDKGYSTVIVTIDPDYRGASQIEVYWGTTDIPTSIVEGGKAEAEYVETTYGYIVVTLTDASGEKHISRMPFAVEGEFPDTTREFTVTFDSQGGTSVPLQVVEYGGTVIEPVDPTKDGYSFKGWIGQDGTLWDFNTPIYMDTILRATWADQPEVDPDNPDKVIAFFTIDESADGWLLDGSESKNAVGWTWLLDSVEVGTGETFLLKTGDVQEGIHNVQLKVEGDDGKFYYSDLQSITKGEVEHDPIYPTAVFMIKETETGWTCDASSSTNATRFVWYLDGQLISGVYSKTLDIDRDELAEGTHEVKLVVYSNTNNFDDCSDKIVVAPEDGGDDESDSEDDIDWMLIACAAIVIVVLIIVIWRFMI